MWTWFIKINVTFLLCSRFHFHIHYYSLFITFFPKTSKSLPRVIWACAWMFSIKNKLKNHQRPSCIPVVRIKLFILCQHAWICKIRKKNIKKSSGTYIDTYMTSVRLHICLNFKTKTISLSCVPPPHLHSIIVPVYHSGGTCSSSVSCVCSTWSGTGWNKLCIMKPEKKPLCFIYMVCCQCLI